MIDIHHPRAKSLKTRDKVVNGVKLGITSMHGLIAQGRGEAFDYLLGEKTQDFAIVTIDAAASMLLLAKYPVLSINGNVAALSAKDYVKLSQLLNCPIEINLFHASSIRQNKIKKLLKSLGAKKILESRGKATVTLKNIASHRKMVSKSGIFQSDVVLVPLEDGDRAQALVKMGKKVITIDLNPLSRTAKTADITIVDNIVRAMPEIVKKTKEFKKLSKQKLQKIVDNYDNKESLRLAEKAIRILPK